MTAYYNEFDPKAAAWLRELIRRGLIAHGVVDERSILEVTADDLRGFTQCHFFAGIGGWSYALRLAGVTDDTPVWTGSPPCQPFSAVGQQKGKDDERHLAPHFAALVADVRPPILFGEQVASAAVFGKSAKKAKGAPDGSPEWAWIDDLSERLEAARYAVGASDIPAASVGAPHIRQRTFFGAVRLDNPAGARHVGPIAEAEGLARDEARLRLLGQGRGQGWLADADRGQRDGVADVQGRERDGAQTGRVESDGQPERRSATDRPRADHGGWHTADWLFCRDGKWRPVEPGTFPLADGLPARVGRLRGYGNAIVPQAAALFIIAFLEAEVAA